MSHKRYLVVHPKLSMIVDGKIKALHQGKEISLGEDEASRLVATGKLKLVVAKAEKPKPAPKKRSKK